MNYCSVLQRHWGTCKCDRVKKATQHTFVSNRLLFKLKDALSTSALASFGDRRSPARPSRATYARVTARRWKTAASLCSATHTGHQWTAATSNSPRQTRRKTKHGPGSFDFDSSVNSLKTLSCLYILSEHLHIFIMFGIYCLSCDEYLLLLVLLTPPPHHHLLLQGELALRALNQKSSRNERRCC